MELLNFIRFMKSFLAIAVVLTIASCSEDPPIEEMKGIMTETQTAVDTTLIEGHYIVVVSKEPAVKSSKAAEVLEQITGEISKQAGAKINRKYTHALSGFAAELTEKQAKELRRDNRVMLVENDRQVYLHNEPVLQEYPYWGLDRIDQRVAEYDRAYFYTATGKGVNAYVMDTGIRVTHEEFNGRAVLGYDFVQEDGPEGRQEHQGGHGCARIGAGQAAS